MLLQTRFLWLSSTPLGKPVVPLEYGRATMSSQPTSTAAGAVVGSGAINAGKERSPLPALHSEAGESVRETIGEGLELPVGQAHVAADDGDVLGPPACRVREHSVVGDPRVLERRAEELRSGEAGCLRHDRSALVDTI